MTSEAILTDVTKVVLKKIQEVLDIQEEHAPIQEEHAENWSGRIILLGQN